jgi:hypothetical protein
MNGQGPIREPRRTSGIDVATMLVALVALAIAIHCRLDPDWPRVAAKENSLDGVNERLRAVEETLREIEQSLGARDEPGRPVAARLALVENQSLLFDETLSRIVGHLKTLEEAGASKRGGR